MSSQAGHIGGVLQVGTMILTEDLLVHIDDFSHEHLAPDIWVEAVDGKACVKLLACGVIEVGLQVYVIVLLADPRIDLGQFLTP